MRIGELSERTGVPRRMLRYYEEQGLIQPTREANGYRDYGEYLVERVIKIRGLIESGIPSRIAVEILPCLDREHEIVARVIEPELRDLLVAERDRMTQKIAFLTSNRDALARYIAAVDAGAGAGAGALEKRAG